MQLRDIVRTWYHGNSVNHILKAPCARCFPTWSNCSWYGALFSDFLFSLPIFGCSPHLIPMSFHLHTSNLFFVSVVNSQVVAIFCVCGEWSGGSGPLKSGGGGGGTYSSNFRWSTSSITDKQKWSSDSDFPGIYGRQFLFHICKIAKVVFVNAPKWLASVLGILE